MICSASGYSAFTGDCPRFSMAIFQKLRGLGRWQPITNLLDRPFLSTVSATMAAITAPTKPTPITTTISLPSLRAWPASFTRRADSDAYSPFWGRGILSPLGLTEYSTLLSAMIDFSRFLRSETTGFVAPCQPESQPLAFLARVHLTTQLTPTHKRGIGNAG